MFLASEKTSSRNLFYSAMQISNALPVQFWLTGCATFNEHYAPGVFHKCYCAPWECDDDIRIQFKDDPSQDYSLLIYDIEEQLLGSFDIEETQVGVYELTLNLAEDSPDVCDQLIQLKIRKNAGMQGFSLPAFTDWVNDGGAGDPWTLGSNPSFVISGSANTEFLIVDFAFIEGLEYSLRLNYTATSSTLSSQLDIYVLDSSNNILFDAGSIYIITSGSNSTDAVEFTATGASTRIGIRIDGGAFDSSTVTLNSVTALRQVGSDEIVAKTDCLDVRENHEQSILLTYSNHRNFAGLVYENTSPNTEFQIRIPSVFFHQRFPEEDEVMELSDQLVTLNGTVRKQRRLDTDYLPYYFHEKLKLILKHQILSVFSRQWVKQEAYEIVEGSRMSPLKMARCWLSEKEFVHRNVL